MRLDLTIDHDTLNQEITFLKGTLTNRTLDEHDRFLVIDLLRILSGIKAALETDLMAAAD